MALSAKKMVKICHNLIVDCDETKLKLLCGQLAVKDYQLYRLFGIGRISVVVIMWLLLKATKNGSNVMIQEYIISLTFKQMAAHYLE